MAIVTTVITHYWNHCYHVNHCYHGITVTGQWGELVEVLVSNVTQGATDNSKEAHLEALGYIVEDIVSSVLIATHSFKLTSEITVYES